MSIKIVLERQLGPEVQQHSWSADTCLSVMAEEPKKRQPGERVEENTHKKRQLWAFTASCSPTSQNIIK